MLLGPSLVWLAGQWGGAGSAPYEAGKVRGVWPLMVEVVRPSCHWPAGRVGNGRDQYLIRLVDSQTCLVELNSYQEPGGHDCYVIWT